MAAGGEGVRLSEMQRAVDAQLHGIYWPPLANLARLAEEVGEVSREVNRRWGAKASKPGEPEGDLALELADVLYAVIALANTAGVDLEEAFARALAKAARRRTP